MNIALDKQAHFMGGFIIAREVGQFSPVAGLITACVAGFGKEAWDKRTHAPDKYDALATILGGLLGSAVSLVERMVRGF